MKTTKCDMISILDTLMNGDVIVLQNIIGDNYDNYLHFYDIFKTLSHLEFQEMIYNPNTIGLEVELFPTSTEDIKFISSVLEEFKAEKDYVDYTIGGSSVIININIGGE